MQFQGNLRLEGEVNDDLRIVIVLKEEGFEFLTKATSRW